MNDEDIRFGLDLSPSGIAQLWLRLQTENGSITWSDGPQERELQCYYSSTCLSDSEGYAMMQDGITLNEFRQMLESSNQRGGSYLDNNDFTNITAACAAGDVTEAFDLRDNHGNYPSIETQRAVCNMMGLPFAPNNTVGGYGNVLTVREGERLMRNGITVEELAIMHDSVNESGAPYLHSDYSALRQACEVGPGGFAMVGVDLRNDDWSPASPSTERRACSVLIGR